MEINQKEKIKMFKQKIFTLKDFLILFLTEGLKAWHYDALCILERHSVKNSYVQNRIKLIGIAIVYEMNC